MTNRAQTLRFGIAIAIILATISYLAVTGASSSRSYYVTLNELHSMGDQAYSKRLRVAGNVLPGSIRLAGTNAQFTLVEQGRALRVDYRGAEPPPDTFKDNAQALADGTYGRDGVFHAHQIQAKCASKYAPAQNGQPSAAPVTKASLAPAASAVSVR